MGQIRLNGMEFYACHGCYHEEQVIGNRFVVDIVMDVDMGRASYSDDLCDALNYAEAYELVKQEMAIRSHLLEHVSARILDRLFEHFPRLDRAEVCVAKLNPPICGQVRSVNVSQQRSR
ncbi:MAG: dihydroneopterin aldolase [Bacteroidales bacterium]|jgi:dihydroneopterin aldolase|nr:dihydroneopterin aldolase [Bacteroidales bacterium]